MLQLLASRPNRRVAPPSGGGGGGLPAWVTANTSAAGQWYVIPNTSISSVDPNPPTNRPAGGTTQQKLDAWCSLAADINNCRIYAGAGGGHTDYDGNEFDMLPLLVTTPGWQELRAPTIPTTANVTHYSDGRPTARHHYYGLVHDPVHNRVMLVGGAGYGNGTPLNNIDGFDLASNDYFAANTFGNLPGSQGVGLLADENRFTGLDPRNGDIYTIGNLYLVKMNGATGVVTTLRSGNAPIQGVQTGGAFDTTRNVFFFPAAQYTYAPDTDTFTSAPMSGAGASAVAGSGQMAVCYYAPLDCFFVRLGSDSGGTIYQITAGTKVCTSYSTSGGSGISAAPGGLLFYKLHPFPALKGLVLVTGYGANASYLRLEA